MNPMAHPTIKTEHYKNLSEGKKHAGRNYKNLPILANRGVHEYVGENLKKLLSPGSKILELGCGSGALSLRLADMGFNVTAIDYVEENFKAEHELISFQQADLNQNLPASTQGQFDAVVAVEIIEHLENTRHFVRLMSAALKPGGLLFITTPNISSPKSLITFMLAGRFDLFLSRHYQKDGHINPVPWFVLQDALQESAFTSIKISSYKSATWSLKGIPGTFLQAFGFLNSFPKGKKLVAQAIKPQAKPDPSIPLGV